MISGFRLMWLMVMFDLPVVTKDDRRNYRRFVDNLEDDGYFRVQFSVYARPCATDENTQVHVNRIMGWLPPAGEIRVLKFTDKQWARMTVYRESRMVATEKAPNQLTIYDESLNPLVDEVGSEEVRYILGTKAALKDQSVAKTQTPEKRVRTTKRAPNTTQAHPQLDIFD